jgi:hypothetical protein
MTTPIYGSIAGADAYHAERGNTAWADAETATKQAALVIASEWIDGKYRTSFPGWKTGARDQVREFPRVNMFDSAGNSIASDVTPVEVEYATYEVALRQVVSPGSLLIDVTEGSQIASVSVSGAVAVTYRGVADASAYQVSIPAVDRILAPILINGGGGSLSGATMLGSGTPGNSPIYPFDPLRSIRH